MEFAQLEEIGCPLCGGSGHPVVIVDHGWQGRRCSGCSVVYISPRPAPEAIVQRYAHDAAHVNAARLSGGGEAGRMHARMVHRVIREVWKAGSQRRPNSLLEIGPGTGYFLDELRRRGFTVSAIEPNEQLAAALRDKGHEVETALLGPASFGGRAFDVIYHRDVLSHLADPIDGLRQMRRHLAPDGLMVFETGNIPDVEERRLSRISDFQYPDHVFFFGEKGVRLLLEQTGFRMVRMTRFAIDAELRLARLLAGAMRVVRGHSLAPAAHDPGLRDRDRGRAVKLRWWVRDQLRYRVRYGLGRQAAGPGKRMTLLVVARLAESPGETGAPRPQP